MAQHMIMGGKVHVYKRGRSRFWQCSTYLGGKNRRVSSKEESLSQAKDFAEDWYLEMRGKLRSGDLIDEKTFRDAAAQFEREYEIITQGQRSPIYVEGHKTRLRVHLIPFFGDMALSAITPGQSAVLYSDPPLTAAALEAMVWPGRRAAASFVGVVHRMGGQPVAREMCAARVAMIAG